MGFVRANIPTRRIQRMWRPFRYFSDSYRKHLAFLGLMSSSYFGTSKIGKEMQDGIMFSVDDRTTQRDMRHSIVAPTPMVYKHQCNENHFASHTPNPIIIHQQETNMTSYVRAVNDYTISVHELYSAKTQKTPTTSAIIAINDAPFGEIQNVSKDLMAFMKTLQFFKSDTGDIKYYDDNGDEALDSHSVYHQHVCLYHIAGGEYIGIEILGTVKMLSITIIGTSNDLIEKIGNFLKETRKKYKTFVEERKDKTFYTISSGQHGFDLEDLNIKCEHSTEIIVDNYNDDFVAVNNVIADAIKEDKRGLILLHGIPGSGKTSYIKHLITSDSTRKIIYIPTHLAGAIASPQFISFVKQQIAGSVLVIEDAEQVLISRESDSSYKEAVSNILNMTDGILADALNLLIICTFNTDTKNLDSALLRKGRLLLQYEFLPLTVEKTDNLTEKLYGRKEGKALPLSEIYNLDYELIKPEEVKKVKFGFA